MTVRIINNHYVVQTNNPSQLKAIFPNAKDAVIKGQFYLAVPMDLDAARVLNNLGYKAESPIRTHYDWPGRYTPRWYQLDTAEFFTYHVRAYCHSSMRTGKTLAALWSADYLRQSGKIKRTLIAAPLSTLWDVWEQNIFESFPLRTFCVLHGSRQKRLDLLAEPHDFYIINHDGIKIIEQDLAKRPDIDHFIIDEADVYRNGRKAKTRYIPMDNILNKQKIVRSAWAMTGTPTPNEPTDAYYQSKLITPEAYRGSFRSFKMETMFQVSTFKWLPKTGAEAAAARIMKPCIRFERTVCTDMEPVFIDRRAQLSAEQEKAYKDLLRKSIAEIRGGVVTAVNAAVLLSKLIQVSCISFDTLVLCSRGYVPIQDISKSDLIWDGEEWVSHSGVQFNGVKKVVDCYSVSMTDDHLVLTTRGWKTAKEISDGDACERFNREEVRVPDSIAERGLYRKSTSLCDMAMSLRLWHGSSSSKPVITKRKSPKRESLWLQIWRVQPNTWTDQYPPAQHMGQNASEMRQSKRQRLFKVWRARYKSLRQVGRIVSEFLGRCSRWIQERVVAGSNRQRRTLFPGELSMGNCYTAGQKSTINVYDRHTKRYYAYGSSSRDMGVEVYNTSRKNNPVQVVDRKSTDYPNKVEVYDILNCGPRNRFVVRGADGKHLIVHNCGVVYDAHGTPTKMDFGPRLAVLEELIEQNNEKVLVFVPFTGVLDALATELRKRWSVETIDGSVSAGKRTDIFRRFRSGKDPHILLCHPKTMAHGLDLSTASLSIWYAPYMSAGTVQQANARTDGSKQKAKIDIAHIYATAEERKAYEAIRTKGRLQDIVLSLANEKM